MTIASIDIGSNTTLLLVAKFNISRQDISTLANYYEVPRISEGLIEGENINESKIEVLLSILTKYQNIINTYNCDRVLVRATNALRIASNSRRIVELIFRSFGWNVEIITGEEEARLAFLGTAFPFEKDSVINVIDIGGGSTELIRGSVNKIFFIKSYDIGVVSLTEKFFNFNPPTENEISNSQNYIDNILSSITEVPIQNGKTIAVAGTPTTLSCIKQNIKVYDEQRIENSFLTLGDIQSTIVQLKRISKNQVSEKYGQVVYGREDVLLAGSLILRSLMKFLKTDNITVSGKGLRYGIVIDYLIKNKFMQT